MKAVVFTLGCKVNEVESAAIMSALEEGGLTVSDKLSPADIYVLNTCAVTAEAERKSRQLISRVKKFNREAAIYVCGCASEKDGSQFAKDGVKFICGARDKEKIVQAILSDIYEKETPCVELGFPKCVRTRAFVKIEDGCNNFCSYCIIPYLRGRVASRSLESIVQEVKRIESPEVVLTGINISAYNGAEGGLAALISALSFTDKRIRLGSLECGIITPEFLLSCKNLKDFAPQFHLSLQSGSDNILRAMNRRYTRKEYLEKCALIYSVFPDAAITTDIIVGFCGESESDFADSLSIIGKARFARVHAFAFSPREGTAAYKLEDIPSDIKKRRLRALIERAKEASAEYINQRINKEYEVIFEDFDGEYTAGYTGGYIRVYAKGELKGRSKVLLTEPFRDGALCRIVD